MTPIRTVQLFSTCLVNELRPEVGIAVVELLERAGLKVEVALAQTCCGQPAWNSGFRDEARAIACHTLRVLSATQGPIVIPSGSCADMLIHQAHELFRGDPEWSPIAANVAERCHEWSQFMVDVLGPQGMELLDPSRPGAAAAPATLATRAPAPTRSTTPPTTEAHPARSRRKVVYHPSCHLSRGLSVRAQPRALLDSLASVEPVVIRDAEECCGFGGMFSVKQSAISGAMLDKKCRAIEAALPDVLVSCDLGCLLQVGGGLQRRGSKVEVCHLAELYAKEMRE